MIILSELLELWSEISPQLALGQFQGEKSQANSAKDKLLVRVWRKPTLMTYKAFEASVRKHGITL